jgi:mediator of RNA polymerase II transcription subunit 13
MLQETLLLEPYGHSRDMLYVVLAPENDYLLGQATNFFQHLSVTYEHCRLGCHRPVSDKLRDGIMRVGRTNAQKVADEPLDDWFRDIGSLLVNCDSSLVIDIKIALHITKVNNSVLWC